MARFGGKRHRLVTLGARKVAEIDSDGVFGRVRVDFRMDDGDGAKKEISDVSEDGGAASGDEVCGEEFVEFGDGVVDAHGGGEFVGFVGEDFAKIVGLPRSKLGDGVLFAEAKSRGAGQLAALAASGGAVAAIGRWNSGRGWFRHESSRFVLRLG